ncbi:MAG: GntP family permease [Nitrospiraceae bacterium]
MIGIVIALGLLIYLAYRGISVLILGPATALLAVLLAGGLPILGSYTQIFMVNVGDFIVLFFPLFMLGAVFGKLMDDSGSAQSIARWIVGKLGGQRAILAVVLSCAVLTYGGVSLFVVAFAVFPIAAALFREANIPKRLIPATIALGAFTFTMTALPGTPAIQNAIPMPFFGTTPFAAPGLGVLTGLVMFVLGNAWLTHQARRAHTAGEGYGAHPDALPAPDRRMREHARGEGFDVMELEGRAMGEVKLVPFPLAIAPVVLVIIVNLLSVKVFIPAMDTDYLVKPLFGSTMVEAVAGLWAVIIALTVSIIFVGGANWRRFASLPQSLDNGANASVLPIFNTASLVGFGAVVAALPAFNLVRDWVLGLGGTNPLISLAVAVNVLAGMTGSASGGMSIALDTLGAAYVNLANDAGISLELMHRVTAVATGGLDSLPHNGAVITLLAICSLGHREAYKDIFVVAALIPIAALILLIVLGGYLGSF